MWALNLDLVEVFKYFDVFLTVHHSTDFFELPT